VVLPLRVSLFLGRILGFLASGLLKKYNDTMKKNLRQAFPEMPMTEILRIIRKTYENMGMNLVEFSLLRFRSKNFWIKRIRIIGNDVLTGYVKKKGGVVYLTAHVGNWELMGSYLSMIGHPVTVVGKDIDDKKLNWLLLAFRECRGVKSIGRSGRDNTKKMIQALKSGEILGVLVDQDTKVGGTFVEFFGKPAYTPTAISQFARLKNTVVLSGFIYREKDYSHTIIVQGPLNGGIDVEKETQEYTGVIENMIREHPADWVWMHKRWKRKPV
jgi:KDO2-lipid IV(A) lauroyltransferase